MMIPLEACITRCDGMVWRKYDGEVVLLSEDGSQMHMLNKVAGYIWELADGNTTVGTIVSKICDRFDVKPDLAQIDTFKFIQTLIDKSLIRLSKTD